MRLRAGFLVAVVLGLLIFVVAGCNKNPAGPNIVTYSYLTPIINPPDTFQVAYNIDISGDHIAHITFGDSAVWKIQALTESRISFGFKNPANNTIVYLKSPDTVGFRSDFQYSFIANNNNASGDTTTDIMGLYYVKFTKLSLDYSSFPKRY